MMLCCLSCFRMGFYFVTTGWIFEISLCENSINQSKYLPLKGNLKGAVFSDYVQINTYTPYRPRPAAVVAQPSISSATTSRIEDQSAECDDQQQQQYIIGKSEFSDSKPVGSSKTRQETDNARDRQYSIGHVPERILVRATMANQLVRATVYG